MPSPGPYSRGWILAARRRHPEYFISHVDVTNIGGYRAATGKLTGEASLGLMLRYLRA